MNGSDLRLMPISGLALCDIAGFFLFHSKEVEDASSTTKEKHRTVI